MSMILYKFMYINRTSDKVYANYKYCILRSLKVNTGLYVKLVTPLT